MSVESGNGRSATLEEVARVAGVSRATVSRVVNGNPKVGVETKREVERAIARLGYVPNPAARSLVTRRSQSIGLVIAEPAGRVFEDPFFPRLLRGIGAALSSRDLQLVLLMPQSSGEEARAERYLTAGHVDGALLVSLHGNDPLPKAVSSRGIPVVVGGRPPRGAEVSYVDVDNVQGARTAVEHLIGSGRKAHRPRSPGPRTCRRAKIDGLGTITPSSPPELPTTRRSKTTGTLRSRAVPKPRDAYSTRDRTSTPSLPHPTSWPQAPCRCFVPPAGGSRRTSRSSASTTRRSP